MIFLLSGVFGDGLRANVISVDKLGAVRADAVEQRVHSLLWRTW